MNRSVADARAPRRPTVVAFDVLGTTFSLDALRDPLVETGLPAEALGELMACILRDGFALSAAGRYADARDVATNALEILLTSRGHEVDDGAIENVVKTFQKLDAYPDTEPAFRRLKGENVTVATLSNGGVDGSRALLERAGLAPLVDAVHGVDEVHRWKPAPEPYLHVADAHHTPLECVALIAAHGWDVMGAREAGLVTGFVARKGRFPRHMGRPDVSGDKLPDVVDALIALPVPAEQASSRVQ